MLHVINELLNPNVESQKCRVTVNMAVSKEQEEYHVQIQEITSEVSREDSWKTKGRSHPILGPIRRVWQWWIEAVTPQRIEYVRQAGPYVIFAYALLSLFGIRKIHQDPRSRLIYAKVVEFARTRYAKLFARGTAVGLAVLLAIVVYTWRLICQETKPKKGIKLDSRPFLAFGGGFFLYPFYWGVVGYLSDNFDVSDVRGSGLSAGIFSLGGMLGDRRPAEIMEVGQYFFIRMINKYGALLMIDAEDVAGFAAKELSILGYTDEMLEGQYAKNRFYSGVSELAWIKIFGIPLIPYLKHRTFKLPTTVMGIARSIAATCTIFPLLGTPLDLFGTNKWHIDGALSASYAIPDDQDPERVVRISPFPFVPVDVRMPFLPWFHCWYIFF